MTARLNLATCCYISQLAINFPPRLHDPYSDLFAADFYLTLLHQVCGMPDTDILIRMKGRGR